MALFDAWADSLLAMGISEITGDVIGDDNVFDDNPLGSDWSWDDTVYGYAAPISGLSFHENVVDITIRPGRSGHPGEITWIPAADDVLEFTQPVGYRARRSARS